MQTVLKELSERETRNLAKVVFHKTSTSYVKMEVVRVANEESEDGRDWVNSIELEEGCFEEKTQQNIWEDGRKR